MAFPEEDPVPNEPETPVEPEPNTPVEEPPPTEPEPPVEEPSPEPAPEVDPPVSEPPAAGEPVQESFSAEELLGADSGAPPAAEAITMEDAKLKAGKTSKNSMYADLNCSASKRLF